MQKVLTSKDILFACLLLCLLGACSGVEPDHYELTKVIDGDSIVVKSYNKANPGFFQSLEVRLLGIDAPEYNQRPWGPKAMNFLQENLSQNLDLEFDSELTDKYGRTLAYVYNDRHKLVNELMLERGYAVLFATKENRLHLREFKEAQLKAKSQHLNIWDEKSGLKMSPYQYRRKHMRKRRSAKK